MTPKCTGTTKAGAPCKWSVWRDTALCVACAARAGNADASAELRTRGNNGTRKQAKARKASQRSACRLRSSDDLLTELERALLQAERSAGEVVSKVKAITAIVSEARAVLRAELLENENRELKRLLLERHPELARHLKAAS